ncbi:MAG: UbiX family flavin prenyltransferase [Desulfurococcales archaeon]|nr:UbiX family flavin prenyltransferase [Desulfurococcales archaeon]
MRIAVCLTGASGVIYGLKLIHELWRKGHEIHAVITKHAVTVSESECFKKEKLLKYIRSKAVATYMDDDLTSPLASSSFILDAVVIAPCSLKTLSDISSSRQDNLVSRTACNALRLRKKVVLLVRETPLSTIDITNMLKASIAGAVVMPASPAFYGNITSVDDIINFIVGKVLDILGIENDLYTRWGSDRTSQRETLCDLLFD